MVGTADQLKVTAYITRYMNGVKQLLIFKEKGYEHLGYQVPGGTVEPDEQLEAAVLREVMEEAGLAARCTAYLGCCSYTSQATGKSTTRHFYEMEATECLETFVHTVVSQDEDNGWVYAYSWKNKSDVDELYGYLGAMLHKI